MKHPILISLVAGGLSLGFLPRADAIAFTPTEGLVLERVIEERNSRSRVEIAIEANGEEVPVEEYPEFDISYEAQVSVTDELAAVEDGRVTRLVRTIDEAWGTRTFEDAESSQDVEKVSMLQEETVVFTWDADAEEYSAAWADEESELEDHYLGSLRADLDLTFFLPDGEVSEGDEWEVEGSEFTPIAFMSVHFGLDENEEADEEQAEAMREMLGELEDAYDGLFTCTYQGTREEDDGTTVAVIAIAGDVGTSREESFEPDLEGAPDGVSLEITVTKYSNVTYEGELLWDVEAGHMTRLEMNGELEFVEEEARSGSTPEEDFEEVFADVYEGEVQWIVTVSPATAG
jgi:hypothetical protein